MPKLPVGTAGAHRAIGRVALGQAGHSRAPAPTLLFLVPVVQNIHE